jgi:hypothetical protein
MLKYKSSTAVMKYVGHVILCQVTAYGTDSLVSLHVIKEPK